jgi:hypothetical protein
MNARAFWLRFERRILSDENYRKGFSERFWKKVFKTTPDDCWEWIGSVAESSYGVINLGGNAGPFTAHRVAWFLANLKRIPPKRHVMHKCNYPPCCNPAHLALGTAKQNIRYSVDCDRNEVPEPKRGELNPASKLSDKDVAFIRKVFEPRCRTGKYCREALSKRFGISGTHVRRIANGLVWKHRPFVVKREKSFLTKRQQSEVLRRFEPKNSKGPNTRAKLAKEFGVPAWAISNLITRQHKKFLPSCE